ERVSTTYKGLAKDAKPGDRLLVDDGKVGLVVKEVQGPDVVCEVTEGGPVSNNKGVSLPGMDVSVPALSDKDIEDLEFALELGVDFIALSFVRSPADIDLVHQVMDRVGKGRRPVVAKIEKPEAVYNLEAIVLAFDAVMVARGDLGVELPLEQVPLVQKRAIQICRENAKPVIVATQMLESMINNSRPTRAEASDVANAVLDGTDAVMLSGETSVGRYPIKTVQTMSRIVEAVETDSPVVPPLSHVPRTKRGVISYAARDIGERLNAKALVAFTQSGDTVRRLARLHTRLPLLAFTPEESVRSQLSMTWGTTTRIEANIFRGVSPAHSPVRVFGGQVAGQALVAAGRTVPEERKVHSLHAYFIRGGDPSVPIVYEVDRIRDGRSFTTRRVVAIQHGKAIFSMSASFQKQEP